MVAVHFKHHSGRCQRELVGRAIAHLDVERAPRARRRDVDRGDELAGLQRGLDIGCRARLAMEVGELHRPRTFGALHLQHRVERHQRLREIAGIGGDALVADAEHRMVAIDAVQRCATRSGHALVALSEGRVSEVRAARALQHVAAEARHVAQARGGGQRHGLGYGGIIALDRGVVGDLGHANQGAEPQTLVAHTDAAGVGIIGERVDVDEVRRAHDIEHHEIDQRRAAGEELRRAADVRAAGIAGCRSNRGGCRGDLLEGEGMHGLRTPSSTWRRRSRRRCWDRRHSGTGCHS